MPKKSTPQQKRDAPEASIRPADGAQARPTKAQAKAQARKKARPRVTNGKDAGNPMTVRESAEPHDSSEREYVRGPYNPPSTPTCGARARQSGQPCKRPAGWGTDHPGSGRCKLHGGLTPAPTGRYASVERPRIRELMERFESDPDPLNLLPEVQLLRALLLDYINRFEAQDTALMRWNLSFEKPFQSEWQDWWRDQQALMLEQADDLTLEDEDRPVMPDPMDFLPAKPLRMADITEVSGLINQVGTMVERIRKARSQDTFTMSTVSALWQTMGGHLTQAAMEVIEDDDIRSTFLTSVEEKWATISLAELARARPGESEEES